MGEAPWFEVLSCKLLVSERKTPEADREIGGPGASEGHSQE
jgi:hypothetical protein